MTTPKAVKEIEEDVIDGEEVIEGGAVRDLEENGDFKIKKEKASTTRILAYILVGILAFSVFGHYGLVAWLVYNGKADAITELSSIFSTWLPVISGLAGSAVTYFFAQGK